MEDSELFGDKVERLLRKAKVDKVLERVTKHPCNKCKQRREFMNAVHKQMQKMHAQILKDQKDASK